MISFFDFVLNVLAISYKTKLTLGYYMISFFDFVLNVLAISYKTKLTLGYYMISFFGVKRSCYLL